MTVNIYHNPSCSKSRQTLALIKERNICPNIIEYLSTKLTHSAINHILIMLNCSTRDIIRSSESAYKTLKLDDDSVTEQELVNAIVERPELLQRPIVIHKQAAVIGRPPEKVLDIL